MHRSSIVSVVEYRHLFISDRHQGSSVQGNTDKDCPGVHFIRVFLFNVVHVLIYQTQIGI